MPSLKVLHVIPSLAIGGTEQQLVQFISRSDQPELHKVAVFDEAGSLADELRDPPSYVGPFRRSLVGLPVNVAAAMRLRRLIRRLKPDLVHAHLGIGEVLAAAAAPRHLPLVASRRGMDPGFQRTPVHAVIKGLAHRRANILICNSQFLADQTLDHDLWPPPVRVVHNAVDPDLFHPAPFPAFGEPTIAVVANLGREKRHDRFLRALAPVRARFPTVRALLVGEGPERSRIMDLARQLGLGQAIELIGSVEDVRPFLWRSHVVALTSDHEGFPNALLEGMSCGRPVVATRVGGIAELVRDGRDGLLLPPSPSAFAGGLVEMLLNQRHLESMGRDAAERASEFGWDRLVRETNEVYREAVERSARESHA
jgi:glycosyltransferase involved in cell wall biosynthesis